jgi:broad specificity phosphatase PhoE
MTTFLLVRHCAVGALGQYLAGRAPNEHLTDEGRAQARGIAGRFHGVALDAVFSSPLERTRETADALAGCAVGGIELSDDLLESDFGDWTGKTFAELQQDPRWAAFHTHRSITRIPGGELILEVQARTVAFLERAASCFPNGRVAVVSHGDVIRAALCFYLGAPLDFIQRFEISPGSVSVLEIGAAGPVVHCMNVQDYDPRNLTHSL